MDLETLLTSREGFGLEQATFLQRAVCRITDGVPLDDLVARGTEYERKCLDAAIGCPVSSLPTEGPPVEVLFEGPVRTGKSLFAVALAVARSQTVDVSIVKSGEEPPRTSLLSTQLDTARAMRGHMNIIHERPMLRALFVGEDGDGVTLRHPSGLPIQNQVIAASRGGFSLAARWATTVIFDEAPGWYSTDKIIALEESRDQAIGRLLPGAQAAYAGSVWQPSGWCFTTDRDNFGRPTPDLVVIRPRAVDGLSPAEQLNPVYWTPERVARIKRTSPRTFRMHVMNEYGGASNVFDVDAVERAFRPFDVRQYTALGSPILILDPSSGKKDTWSFAFVQWLAPLLPDDAYERRDLVDHRGYVISPNQIVRNDLGQPMIRAEFEGHVRPVLRFFHIDGYAGHFFDQLNADAILDRLASLAARYGARDCHSDQRESFMLKAAAERRHFRFFEWPYSAESKPAAVAHARRWIADGAVSFVEHGRLQAEFDQFVEKPTPAGGFTFGARGSGHDDYVSLVLTAALADMHGALRGSPLKPASGHRVPGRSLLNPGNISPV